MSRQNLVGLLALWGDPERRSVIEAGASNFRTNPNAQRFTLTADDFETIEGLLSAEERALITAFKEFNETFISGRLMEASLELRGTAPDPIAGYFPSKRNMEQAPADLPEGWRGVMHRAMEDIRSLEERTADTSTPLLVPEFVTDTMRYVHDAARVMHLAGPVGDRQQLREARCVHSPLQQHRRCG